MLAISTAVGYKEVNCTEPSPSARVSWNIPANLKSANPG